VKFFHSFPFNADDIMRGVLSPRTLYTVKPWLFYIDVILSEFKLCYHLLTSFRSIQFLQLSLIRLPDLLANSVALQPGSSSPYLQEPAISPILSQLNPLHPPDNVPKIHYDTILPSTPWSSECCLSIVLSHQNLITFVPLPCVPHVQPTSFFLI
jgi:hypothetical protein